MTPDIHELPKAATGQREHQLDRGCWCFPLLAEYPDGTTYVIHRDTPRR